MDKKKKEKKDKERENEKEKIALTKEKVQKKRQATSPVTTIQRSRPENRYRLGAQTDRTSFSQSWTPLCPIKMYFKLENSFDTESLVSLAERSRERGSSCVLVLYPWSRLMSDRWSKVL